MFKIQIRMKSFKIFLALIAFITCGLTLEAQTLEYGETVKLKKITKKMKKGKDFIFKGFERANVYAISASGKEFLVKDQMINYNQKTNTLYILENNEAKALNSNSINGVFFNNRTILKKLNSDHPDQFCEVIYMTEKIYVYHMNGINYAEKGSNDVQLNNSLDHIESVFGLERKSVERFVELNKLDIEKKKDLARILNQYEVSNKS